MATTVEDLPVGVGRVPEWWMECTPHYRLDLDEEQAQRQLEEQMATFFNQFAEINDMGAFFDEEGHLKLGPDQTPLAYNSNTNWQGRSGTGQESPASPGSRGRNFRIDPKVLEGFGVRESDPNYQDYLAGAKLPPGFIEKLRTMYGSDGIPNNLQQTDYGRYGRQAEKPVFKPNWTKTKLRSTAAGQNIRQGQYNDSPNKHYRRRVQLDESPVVSPAAVEIIPTVVIDAPVPQSEVKPELEPEPAIVLAPEPELCPEPTPALEENDDYFEARADEIEEESVIINDEDDTYVEEGQGEEIDEAYENVEAEADVEAIEHGEEEADDTAGGQGEEEAYDEDEDGGEMEDEDDDDDDDLADLQAILAAKQAELAKLQEQL